MKKLFGLFVILTTIFLFQHNAMAAEPIKIGILDLQECLSKSNEGIRIKQSLKKKLDSMQKKVDEAQKELVDMQKEMEKQSLMLSLDAKEDKQKEFEKKRRDLGYLIQDLNEEAKKAEAEAKQEFVNELEPVLKMVSEEGEFDLILERLGGGVLFTSDALDITGHVIEELNKAKP
jgi:outer membrane protein